MPPSILKRQEVFATPWFRVIAKELNGDPDVHPYYAIELPDYVVVVALTSQQQIVLVRQYRPAVEEVTLELPSGLVDSGETPERTACREVSEETGFEVTRIRLAGTMLTDTGRLSNRTWCYVAEVTPAPITAPEAGIEIEVLDYRDFIAQLQGASQHELHATHLAALYLAQTRGLTPA